MARAGKLNLRAFQQELATRLAAKTTAQVEQSRLGLACAGSQWLIRLADAGEVIAVPTVATVPLTRSWYLGIANIRGNLYSIIDFGGFLGHWSGCWGCATLSSSCEAIQRPTRLHGTARAGPIARAECGRKSI